MAQLRLLILTACMFVSVACTSDEFRSETVLEQAFQVGDNPTINLQSMTGNLQVVTGLENEIQVSAQLIGSGSSEEIAAANLDTLQLNFSQEEDTIFIVGSQVLDSSRMGVGWINYTITTPANTEFNFEMKTPPGFVGVSSEANNAFFALALIVVGLLVILALILGMRVRKANAENLKLSTELRALRGSLHMKNLEQKWAQDKQEKQRGY
jgi:hypothetical protein